MGTYQEIDLARIRNNPMNPRKRFEGPKFDELVASIKAKGVLEPIILRPMNDAKGREGLNHPLYQIVVGERRFRASAIAGRENIPCLIRDLSDEEAFDFLTIENLQREDLTELEEVQSFKTYVDRKGDGAIPDLAERTGINASYIRRRLRVLSLPAVILKAWNDGKLFYGHLEQLRRLHDDKKILELFKSTLQRNRYDEDSQGPAGIKPVSSLKRMIDEQAIDLKQAFFDKIYCKACEKNSTVQQSLFGLQDLAKAHCMDAACFKQKQNNWLMVPENWKKTKWAKQHKTNGFRFQEGLDYRQYESMWNSIRKECLKCENFISIIPLLGDRNDRSSPVCIDLACFKKTFRSKEALGRGKTLGENRSYNHGLLFREEFFKTRIPEVTKEISPEHEKIARLTLASILHSNEILEDWFVETYRGKKSMGARRWIRDMYETWKFIEGMDPVKVREAVKEASLKIALDQPLFGPKARALVGSYFGLALARDWRIHEGYLKAKTKKEILQIGKDLKVLQDKKAQTYLYETLGKKQGKFDGCKKTELIDIFLKSGVDLAGKVPKEILEVGK